MDLSQIPIVVLFIITSISCVYFTNFRAYYVKKFLASDSELYLLNSGLSLTCAFVLLIFSGFNFNISIYSLLLGLAFGIITMLNSILNSKAIKIGPFGFTMVISYMSTAITSLSGAIFWGEHLTITKIIGIVLMLTCFFFAVDTKDKNGKKANFFWFFLTLVCLFCTSGIGLIQKIHQTSTYKGELIQFLTSSFIVGGIISFVAFFIVKGKEKGVDNNKNKNYKSFIVLSVVTMVSCGIGVAINNAFNLYLAGVVETAIFFPIANGVPLLSCLIVSFLFFKEKLKTKQLIGLGIGLLSIVFLLV